MVAVTFIGRILARKGQDVLTAPGDSTVWQASKLMLDRKVGCVVVVGANNKPLGIFTERDYFRRTMDLDPGTTAFGHLMNRTTLAEVMVKNVITGTVGMAKGTVMDIFTSHKIRHLPIADEDKRMVGIITIGDVVKQSLVDAENEAEAIRDYIRTA